MTFYASGLLTEVRVAKLMTTFTDGLIILPYSSNDRVFFRPSEKEDNFIFVYEYFRDFGISFPLLHLRVIVVHSFCSP